MQAAPRALPYLTEGDNHMILYSEQRATPLSIEPPVAGDKGVLFSNGLKITFSPVGPGDLAASFYDKLPEYMMEQRYMRMVEAGRSAMDSWTSGDEGTPVIRPKRRETMQ